MPKNRFYLDAALKSGELLALEDVEAHHLIHVMRQRVGDEVELVNGRGVLAEAHVEKLERQRAWLAVDTSVTQESDPFELIIVQALPRINRLDLIVEKGTELGMTALWLLAGDKSERKSLSESQQKRLDAIAIAAMKQCGRLYLPTIKTVDPLRDWSTLAYPSYFGALDSEAPAFGVAWRKQGPQKGVLFFVGPEAGFSDAEIQAMQQLGALGVSLHPNILRTDTAPLVAASLISHWRLEEKTTNIV